MEGNMKMINTEPLKKEVYVNNLEGENMININKPDGDNRTREEKIAKIVERTGVSAIEAAEALDRNNGDLLDAMIYVERNYGQASKAASANTAADNTQNTAQNTAEYAQNTASFNVNEQKPQGSCNVDFTKATGKVKDFLLNNSLVIYNGDAEVLSLPVLVCVIALLISVNTALLAAVIAMFFGIRYQFRGPQLGKTGVNLALNTFSGIIKNLKTSVFGAE